MEQLSGRGKLVQRLFRELSAPDRAEIIKQEVIALAAEVAEAAVTAPPQRRTTAHLEILERIANAEEAGLAQGVAEMLITNAGGIFLGEKQLKELGVIATSARIPPVPEKFSNAFLNAEHPLRSGKIAEHIILGFDLDTNEWYCFEKSIVPDSLSKDGRGLSGPEQDKLLLDRNGQPYTVEGKKYSSPPDYRPIASVLDKVIRLQLSNCANENDLPFHGIFGRTADTQNAASGCRVVLGFSPGNGSLEMYRHCAAGLALTDTGLLAGWN